MTKLRGALRPAIPAIPIGGQGPRDANYIEPMRWGPFVSLEDFLRHWVFDEWYYNEQVSLGEYGSGFLGWDGYLEFGQFQGLSPSPFLSPVTWDLPADRPTLIAFWRESVRPAYVCPLLEPLSYSLQNADVRASGLDPTAHWLLYGIFEGRNPHPSIELDPLPARDQTDEARYEALHTVPSLDYLVIRHARRSVINVQALQTAFPQETTFVERALLGELVFCTDPQILFGPLDEVLLSRPELLAYAETEGDR